MRLDQYIVHMGWSPSRTKAQEMIERGDVRVLLNGNSVDPKPSMEVTDDLRVLVVSQEINKYVSRAGLKLEGALARTELSVKGKLFLDVGQSTGGFTDCLLQAGAEVVVGLDSGHGQLHDTIRKHDKVIYFENINARELQNLPVITSHFPDDGFNGIVMDVSFISQKILWASCLPYLQVGGDFIGLVKPQFEVGIDKLDKHGIVKDENLFTVVKCEIVEGLKNLNMDVIDYFPCTLPGRDGNQEFFVHARKRKMI
jgi:23S rRNA (cytidine1920-2'-O)/16S rRNA (cytidine1409-2'-O)-methyltransferase